MATYNELEQRIEELKARTGRASISPDETFGIMDEMLGKLKSVDMNAASMSIQKTYESLAAMNADANPTDNEGRTLKAGQLVSVVNDAAPSENGIFRWLLPGWEKAGDLGDMRDYAKQDDLAQLAGEVTKKEDVPIYYTLKGRYIGKDGNEYNDGQLKCTPYLPITGNAPILLDCRYGSNCVGVYFYDKIKKPISYLDLPTGSYSGLQVAVASIPTEARFIRASVIATVDANVYEGVNNISLSQRIDDLEEVNFFCNISVLKNRYDFTNRVEAMASLPVNYRKSGGYYTFKLTMGWDTIQYNSTVVSDSAFLNEENYVDSNEIGAKRTVSDEYVMAITDSNNKMLFWIDNIGETHFFSQALPVEESSLDYLYSILDTDGRILFAIQKDGQIVGEVKNKKSQYSNNLENQDSSSIAIKSGSYGGENSVYHIPITNNVFRIVFDFKLIENVNADGERGTIAGLFYGKDLKATIKTIKAKTSDLFRNNIYNPTPTLLQSPRYNSGFEILGVDHIRDSLHSEPLVGEIAFSIWLKGSDKPIADFLGENTETGEQWLSEREQWLSDNRDYALVIDNDTLSIIRDGRDVAEGFPQFNNGQTSIIYSTSLKENGSWKTLKALYEELKNQASGALKDIWLNFYALSSRATCADIQQFGKVKMVGRYYQNISNISGGSNETQGIHYDSFPIPIRYAVDNKKHTCEVIGVNGYIYGQIDGEMTSIVNHGIDSITIGGGVRPYNLSVSMGDTGDAELINTGTEYVQTIISKRSPYIIGIMGHVLVDNIEGNINDPAGLVQTLTRMEDVCVHLKSKGYNVISIDELVKMRSRDIYDNKRNAFFVFDDRRIGDVYENIRHRQSISKYGYTANLASIMVGTYEDNPAKYFPLITSMRSNGWNNLSHTYFHNVTYMVKNSVILWAELEKILQVADALNMNNNAMCYSFSGGWEVTHTMLRMRGFAIAILNNAPYYSLLSRNRYAIARVNMADYLKWEVILKYII